MNNTTQITTLLILAATLALIITIACTSDAPDTATLSRQQSGITATQNPDEQNRRHEHRLDKVRARGRLICSTGSNVPGFHTISDDGEVIGFDADICRAVATAVLGNPDAVEFRFTTLAERGPFLQSGEIDLMNLTITATSSRNASWGNASVIMYYDGQAFLIRKSLQIQSVLQLAGAAICVASATTTEQNLSDYFRENDLEFTLASFDRTDTALDAYMAGQCDAITTDRSGLAGFLTRIPNAESHTILPETISEEPLVPYLPHGDEQWFDIVNTVMAGLIYAEAYNIDSSNVDAIAASENVKAKRLLGTEGNFGQETLGLEKTFMQDVIKQVGNYGEIYQRNLGADGIGLPRKGRNDLWINGGQIYAPPLR